MKLFAILDVKANVFMKPFSELNSASAMRSFDVAVNGADSQFKRFPDDFALCELAEFDEFEGKLTPLVSYLNLGNARSFLRDPADAVSAAKSFG